MFGSVVSQLALVIIWPRSFNLMSNASNPRPWVLGFLPVATKMTSDSISCALSSLLSLYCTFPFDFDLVAD